MRGATRASRCKPTQTLWHRPALRQAVFWPFKSHYLPPPPVLTPFTSPSQPSPPTSSTALHNAGSSSITQKHRKLATQSSHCRLSLAQSTHVSLRHTMHLQTLKLQLRALRTFSQCCHHRFLMIVFVTRHTTFYLWCLSHVTRHTSHFTRHTFQPWCSYTGAATNG